MDQLIVNQSGVTGVTYVRSDGTMGYFTPGDGDSYTSPPGAFAYFQLSQDSETGDYYLKDPSDGSLEVFGSDGTLQTVYDRDGNATVYAAISGGFTVTTQPSGSDGVTTTYTYLDDTTLVHTISGATQPTLTLAYTDTTSGQLQYVYEPTPDGTGTQRLATFGYDSTTELMTSYADADGNSTGFAFRLDGTLKTATAADSSVTGYQSALSPPLADSGGDDSAGSSSLVSGLSGHFGYGGGGGNRPEPQPDDRDL